MIAFYTKNQFDKEYWTKFREYELNDDPHVIKFFQSMDHQKHIEDVIAAILRNTSFWDTDLTSIPGLKEKVAGDIRDIGKHGMRGAIKNLLTYIKTEKVRVEKKHE